MESAREYLTEEKIYSLAATALADAWILEKDYLKRNPGNKVQAERERMAWERLKTLQLMAIEKGYNL